MLRKDIRVLLFYIIKVDSGTGRVQYEYARTIDEAIKIKPVNNNGEMPLITFI